ncbi:MAG: DUF4234 domain-containing protein [Cellvibrionaceae bacterium]
MENLIQLRERINTPTLTLVLLTIFSWGIYPMLWLFRYNPMINQALNRSIVKDGYILAIAICSGISGVLLGATEEALIGLGTLLALAIQVLYIVWGFQAKTALEEYLRDEGVTEVKLNPFYTFAFSYFYINYQINKLSEQAGAIATTQVN